MHPLAILRVQLNFECLKQTQHTEMGTALLMAFAFISAVLLLNMLIAVLTRTVEDVRDAEGTRYVARLQLSPYMTCMDASVADLSFSLIRVQLMAGAEDLEPLPPPFNLLSIPWLVARVLVIAPLRRLCHGKKQADTAHSRSGARIAMVERLEAQLRDRLKSWVRRCYREKLDLVNDILLYLQFHEEDARPSLEYECLHSSLSLSLCAQ